MYPDKARLTFAYSPRMFVYYLPIFILSQTKDKAVLFSSSSFPLFLFHLHFGSCSRASSSAMTFSLPLLPSQMNDTFFLSFRWILLIFIICCCYGKKVSFYSNQRKELCTFHLLCNFLWFLDMMLSLVHSLTASSMAILFHIFHLFPFFATAKIVGPLLGCLLISMHILLSICHITSVAAWCPKRELKLASWYW
jgi:hypothetical protein